MVEMVVREILSVVNIWSCVVIELRIFFVLSIKERECLSDGDSNIVFTASTSMNTSSFLFISKRCDSKLILTLSMSFHDLAICSSRETFYSAIQLTEICFKTINVIAL